MLTKEQKVLRGRGIGGSEAGAVVGLSRFKTPLDIYLDKTGERPLPEVDSQAAYWGCQLEDKIAQEYSKRTGKTVSVLDQTLFHTRHRFMLASVDRKIEGEKAILECKTTNAFQAHQWGKAGSDEIPDEYLVQCAHYAAVCDAERVDIAVLIGGQDFRIYHYYRNPKLEKRLIAIEADFWVNHVEKRIPPEPRSYGEALDLWPTAQTESTQTATQKEIDAIEKLKNTRALIAALQEKESSYKAVIGKAMTEASILVDLMGTRLVSWKNQALTQFDLQAFKKEYPDLYRQFCKSGETRVLRLLD